MDARTLVRHLLGLGWDEYQSAHQERIRGIDKRLRLTEERIRKAEDEDARVRAIEIRKNVIGRSQEDS